MLAPIVTAYAVGVAMNGFLPANIGTFVTLLMFVAIIPSCTFAGALAAYLVQKIFFTIAGTFVYLYLFLSVPGSFNENLGNISEHPLFTVGILLGGAFLLVLLGADLLAPPQEALGAGEGGRRDPRPAQAILDEGLPPFIPVLAVQAGGDRDLPRGVCDSRHLPGGDDQLLCGRVVDRGSFATSQHVFSARAFVACVTPTAPG